MNDVVTPMPFRPDHLDLMVMRDLERKLTDVERIQHLSTVGHFWSVMKDGRLIAVVGWLELWEGTWEVFVLPSIYIRQYAKSFLRFIKHSLRRLREDFDVVRMQSQSVADDLHDTWMEHLGFTCEGTLRKYTSGLDFRMWAWVRPD